MTFNPMHYRPATDEAAVKREIIGYFFDHPVAKTMDVVVALRGRYMEAAVRSVLMRMQSQGYVMRNSKREPWRLAIGKVAWTNTVVSNQLAS